MRQRLGVVLFTLAVTVVCGGLVCGVNALLADRTASNAQAARQRVVLRLLQGTAEADGLPGDRVAALFQERVDTVTLQGSGQAPLTAFRQKGTAAATIVFPFRGQGFWDAISGYLAVDPASKKIVGIEFTEHAETPGLGGRISEPAFRARFAGKPLDQPGPDGRRLRLVSEGTAAQPTEIDGITGASETSRAVERIVNHAADTILAFLAAGGQP